ncbi:MAG: hypothetical protein ABSB32_16590, partial [Thermodesulfobacteriota bacterium]
RFFMIIGLPKEVKDNEYRVAMTPGCVKQLVEAGHQVLVQVHTTKTGAPKILAECTLPITAKACVGTIITELAVLDVTPEGLVLKELSEGTDIETVKSLTAALFIVKSGSIPRFY